MRALLRFFIIVTLIAAEGSTLSAKTSRHWNHGRGYSPFKYGTTEGIVINNQSDTLQYDFFRLDKPSDDFYLNFRAKNHNGHPNKKYPYYNGEGGKKIIKNPLWGFFITTETDTFAVTITSREILLEIESVGAADIQFHDFSTGETIVKTLSKEINPYSGDNLWSVMSSKGTLSFFGGDRGLHEIFSFPSSSPVTGFGFMSGWGCNLLVTDVNLDDNTDINDSTYPNIDPSQLQDFISGSDDPLEGRWVIFDRELEENLLKMGGNYQLVCIKNEPKYYLIYLEGAAVNSDIWQPGDIKAVLCPSPFEGIYDVIWIDSEKEEMRNEIKAQTGDGNTLTIQFPYQSSKIRLRKIGS